MPQLVRIERIPPTRINTENRGDRVVYKSRNKDTASFVAYSSPNSIHAAQLAQIALAIQSDERDERDGPSRGFLSAPLSYLQRQIGMVAEPEEPRREITTGDQYQRKLPALAAPEYHQRWTPATDEAPYAPAVVDPSSVTSAEDEETAFSYVPHDKYAPSITSVSTVDSIPYKVSSTRAASFDQQPQVTRLHEEDRTTYTVRSANGKLYVSAPAGTSEAQMFDEVARLGSEPRKERSSERRVLVADRHSHRHKHRSRRSSR